MTPDPSDPIPPKVAWYWEQMYPPYRRHSSPATITIVASTILVYLVQIFFHQFYHSEWVANLLAFSPESFEDGDYWRIITYAWIHSEELPIHILFNMLMVWALGGEIERILGSLRFLALYFGSVIAAALVFWMWSSSDYEAVAGASGAAFALLTSLAVLCPMRRLNVLLLLVIPMRMKVVTLAWVTCAVELFCQIFGLLGFISHTAHLGGALFGVALTFLLKPKRPKPIVFDTGIFPPP